LLSLEEAVFGSLQLENAGCFPAGTKTFQAVGFAAVEQGL